MKQGDIEMMEHTHSESGFTADNCPICGTATQILHVDEKQIEVGEPEHQSMAQEDIDQVNETLREFRERLNLSRHDIEKGTGLAGSVVWRAEQIGKTVTAEQRTKIWDFLVGYEGANPEGKPKPVAKKQSVKKISDGVAAVLAKQELKRLQEVVEAAIAELDKQITEAKKLKRPVAPLKAVLDILAPKSE